MTYGHLHATTTDSLAWKCLDGVDTVRADPIARMVLPDPAELWPSPHMVADPLGEEPHTVSPRLATATGTGRCCW